MGRIKCLKLKCECGREGLAQVFLRKDGSISYARVRHYSHIDAVTKKPQFTYCKLIDLEALKTLLLNHGISLSITNGQLGQTNNGSNNLSISSSKLEYMAGGEGFEPSTPNLGGWCSLRDESKSKRDPPFTENSPIRTELLAHSFKKDTPRIQTFLPYLERKGNSQTPSEHKSRKHFGLLVVAFALTEIAKNNPAAKKELEAKIKQIIKNEKNSGVKNVYLKALKQLSITRGDVN